MVYRLVQVCFLLGMFAAFSSVSIALPCSDGKSPIGSLINFDKATKSTKIPLILIHGINGTRADESVTALARRKADPNWKDEYWRVFIERYWLDQDSDLSRKYQLFVFKYCSNRESVQKLANILGRAIDTTIPDRRHVIVAHSMGGLVAKAYMAEYKHAGSRWSGNTGGDTTLGIITLATPHHGTPGANAMRSLEPFIVAGASPDYLSRSKRVLFELLMRAYWKEHHSDSSSYNRSDLRWDNYDRRFSPDETDINDALSTLNVKFGTYSSKLIAYGGSLDSGSPPLTLLTAVAELQNASEDEDEQALMRDHNKLALTNFAFVKGLNRAFGDTDGMVPIDSALNCVSKLQPNPLPENFICTTASRVRRFEAGDETADLPDTNTLSIHRTRRGFDHLDMFTDTDVLRFLLIDLLNFGIS